MNHGRSLLPLLAVMTLAATAATAVPPTELAQRRSSLLESLAQEPTTGEGALGRSADGRQRSGEALIVLFSPAAAPRSGDTDWPFRQEDNLYYLTGIDEPQVTLVLMPGEEGASEMLFARPPDPRTEAWNGRMPSFDELASSSGVERLETADSFESFLDAALGNHAWGESELYRYYRPPSFPRFSNAVREGRVTVWLLLGDRPAGSLPSRELRFANELRERYPEITVRDLTPRIEALREIKSAAEVELIERAIEITVEAHKAAMVRAQSATHEYQVEAIIEFTFRDLGGCCPAFPSIVAGGANGTMLHYNTNDDRLSRDDLILIDIGAEYGHYSADVTRTTPLGGAFSPPQREIYEVVLEAWNRGLALMRPGSSLREVHELSSEVIGEGLLELGLISANTPEQVKLYFFHGVGHPLGLWTHDVFDRTRSFEAGMMVTLEPGVYVRPDDVTASDTYAALAADEQAGITQALERYAGIGVRIEDAVLITTGEPRVLSAGAPRTIEEIESFLAEQR